MPRTYAAPTSVDEIFDEECYSDLADEFNDFADNDPRRPTEDMFDEEGVVSAKRFAKKHRLRWPPRIGDYDRYYEWVNTGRYPSD